MGGARAGFLPRAKAGLAAALLLGGLGLTLPAQDVVGGGVAPVSVAQAKTSNLSSYGSSTSIVKNGVFAISASEYTDRVNAAFEALGQPDYKVSLTKGVDGKTLDMDIRYKSELVGFAEFCWSDESNSWIGYGKRDSGKAFDYILAQWFSGDDMAEYGCYSIMALTMAADPSLDKYDAQTILNYLIDNAESIKDGYLGSSGHQNGIKYGFMITPSGSPAFTIDCS